MGEETLKHERYQNICTDQGGEYLSVAFIEHFEEHGTHHKLTIHDSSQQDSKAKQLNSTMVEGAQALLIRSGLPRYSGQQNLYNVLYFYKDASIS